MKVEKPGEWGRWGWGRGGGEGGFHIVPGKHLQKISQAKVPYEQLKEEAEWEGGVIVFSYAKAFLVFDFSCDFLGSANLL